MNGRLTVALGVRYDPYFPYSERERRFACFQQGVQSTRYPNAPAGLTFAGDKGCPQAGINSQLNAVAPRVGFAYKLTQDSKTSIRGGVGYYYNAISADAQTSHYNAPFAPVFNFTGVLNFTNPFGSVGVPNPFPARFGGTVIPPPNVTFQTPTALQVSSSDLRIPLLTTWNLTVERQLLSNWLIRAGYVGNKGTHLSTVFQNNLELNPAIYIPGQSTVANTQARRPYQNFTNISEVSVSGNNSHYEAVQLTIEKRFVRGLSLLATYTHAKTMDDFGWTNPFNRRFDYAKSNDNLPNNLNFSGVWDIPLPHRGSAFVNQVLNGWHLTDIISWHDGFPLTIASGVDNSLSGVGRDRADFSGTDIHAAFTGFGASHARQVARFFDTSLFARNAVGTFGNSGRNILLGPRFFQTNIGLFKTTRISDRISWQFRAEFFNAFNNVNFNNPGTTVGTATFGVISAAADPRILQFGVKLLF